jgi:hypothetical protein
MKKLTLLFFSVILVSSLGSPAISHSAFAIHLKNGGRIVTYGYWEEKNEWRFFIPGGVMGIQKNFVRKIEKSDDAVVGAYQAKTPATEPEKEAEPKTEAILPPPRPGEKIDLKAYQDKMAGLKAELNKTLTRIKKANADKDTIAKDEATEDNRRISAEMWALTDELKAKNNGQLPADWWAGVGQE